MAGERPRYWPPKARTIEGRECPPAYSIPCTDLDVDGVVSWVVLDDLNVWTCKTHSSKTCECVTAARFYATVEKNRKSGE